MAKSSSVVVKEIDEKGCEKGRFLASIGHHLQNRAPAETAWLRVTKVRLLPRRGLHLQCLENRVAALAGWTLSCNRAVASAWCVNIKNREM